MEDAQTHVVVAIAMKKGVIAILGVMRIILALQMRHQGHQ